MPGVTIEGYAPTLHLAGQRSAGCSGADSIATTPPMPEPKFLKAETLVPFPEVEGQILEFWKKHRIFEKSLELRKGGTPFVFYEGPPTANGLPHNGHVLTRVIKDVFPRYRTMRGYHVPRKAGWDTHGLPVEVEVEKELGIHGKAAIEEFGVEAFVKRCIESVFRYTNEWERLTERIGFWVDLSEAYVTFHKSYIERAVQSGTALPGPQGDLVVAAGRDRSVIRGSGPELQDGG